MVQLMAPRCCFIDCMPSRSLQNVITLMWARQLLVREACGTAQVGAVHELVLVVGMHWCARPALDMQSANYKLPV